MTSNEGLDCLAPDKRGLQIDLLDPTKIVLPLPASQSDCAPMQLFCLVTNYAFHSIPYVYGILSPELLNSAGQVVQAQRLVAPQAIPEDNPVAVMPPLLYGICLPPQQRFPQSLSVTLFWQDKSLHLQVDLSNRFRVAHSHSSWLFADLSSGTYQMRLSYTQPAFAFTLVEEVDMLSFAATTPTTACSAPMELRLVEQSSENPVIEVEGVCFETVVPTEPILIPPPQSGVRVPIELGLRITNHSTTPYRFSSYVSSLLVDMLEKQEPLPRQLRERGIPSYVGPSETDFQWLATDESLILPATASLEWQSEGKLVLIRHGSPEDFGLGAWEIGELEAGTYQIRVTYRTVSKASIETPCNYEEFWYGMVHTPFKAIELIATQSH